MRASRARCATSSGVMAATMRSLGDGRFCFGARRGDGAASDGARHEKSEHCEQDGGKEEREAQPENVRKHTTDEGADRDRPPTHEAVRAVDATKDAGRDDLLPQRDGE